ncbi:hypothetical protein Q6251_33865, partial [Klebsiella quasipneumoniae]|nr:hypothetical protein [Klebsiella quasipneumoniae]
WGSGQAALELSRHDSPLARTSPGSGRWLSLALCLLLAELLFPLLIWGSGQAALELSRHDSPLARTSPGSG